MEFVLSCMSHENVMFLLTRHSRPKGILDISLMLKLSINFAPSLDTRIMMAS